jgi:hypothetical protein
MKEVYTKEYKQMNKPQKRVLFKKKNQKRRRQKILSLTTTDQNLFLVLFSLNSMMPLRKEMETEYMTYTNLSSYYTKPMTK